MKTGNHELRFILCRQYGCVSESILTLHDSAKRGLVAVNLIILNRSQVTRTTPELASPSPNFHTTPTGGSLSYDIFNMNRPPLGGSSTVANTVSIIRAVVLTRRRNMSHSSCHNRFIERHTFGDRLISRFGPVNWPPRSCDLTPLDYFLWGYVKSLKLLHESSKILVSLGGRPPYMSNMKQTVLVWLLLGQAVGERPAMLRSGHTRAQRHVASLKRSRTRSGSTPRPSSLIIGRPQKSALDLPSPIRAEHINTFPGRMECKGASILMKHLDTFFITPPLFHKPILLTPALE
ncbi:hypothetical protein TNCV_1065621 [Trichonephila clavipes]|nr:hypothetical protein TNCV_1065621 [Trichonephila clavipes]